jgi:hypothetical protein
MTARDLPGTAAVVIIIGILSAANRRLQAAADIHRMSRLMRRSASTTLSAGDRVHGAGWRPNAAKGRGLLSAPNQFGTFLRADIALKAGAIVVL